ncbi:beta-phosphoglucomutase [Zunongwangia sp. F363]|uniref:Beta-phosphoglucomutase n=1 Tax=Autumnicola tepida TaxID=3075595 RepID=A0ABU3CDD1_9FLAO|nr:beta-phosphoglucomutase [Zunongwangia sp. F363]MDT0644340.1 beta-phosphoglucomutase [Zunongwangia sp. F363]
MKNSGAVIFDLDGIVVDTTGLQFLAWRKIANDFGFDFSKDQNEGLKGLSREDCLKQILAWGNIKLSVKDFHKWMDIKNSYYLNYIYEMDASAILPGTLELMDVLQEENIPFALGSASKSGKIVLKQLGIYSRFDAVVDGNDVKNGKPDPEIFLLAANRLGFAPSACVVFEDAVAGVQAANRAGMISIGVGNKGLQKEADFTFNNLTEVTREFLQNFLLFQS